MRWALVAVAGAVAVVGCDSTPSSQTTAINEVALVVDGGRASSSGGTLNGIYTSVTLCEPGTSVCKLIDHVLVDTGSSGLRILASEVSGLTLTGEQDAQGRSIVECAVFGGGFTWGPVVTADLQIAGEAAAGLPIQVIVDANAAPAVPAACSSAGGGMQEDSTTLGGNGLLGVGFFPEDCGSACATAGTVVPAPYYGCAGGGGCAATGVGVSEQVANPVARFASDNNGVVISLPAVSSAGEATLGGTLLFGIGTQSNNGLGQATVLAVNTARSCLNDQPVDCFDITTVYSNPTSHASSTLMGSFIDSGTGALLFPDTTIPICGGSTFLADLYCPSAPLVLSAKNQGTNGRASTVGFEIASARALFAANPSAIAYQNIGGDTGAAVSGVYSGFAWGAPFFFGRSVFTALEGATTPGGDGPYWAY